MNDTPKGMRRHIVALGRRNAGKSTLINGLARQQVSIVSEFPGATTDPVEKTMELKPLGPVVLIDTAGTDDQGSLGELRAKRSFEVLARSDAALLVTDGDSWDQTEADLVDSLQKSNVPFLIVRNKSESGLIDSRAWAKANGLSPELPIIDVSAKNGANLDAVVAGLAALVKPDAEKRLLSDLVPANGVIALVVPLDTGAPKGRLILPQVQAIRDCLDGGQICVVATEKQYPEIFAKLASPPDLVVCDSQVVNLVAELTPAEVPLTTFSILMARFKGDLNSFAAGAAALNRLKPGDHVLIQEACSHHAQEDDIGRVKIPRLLRKMAGGDLEISHSQGKELIAYEPDIKAIVHCGACVITQKQMTARQANAGTIPMTNYGMAISLAQGILPRALAVFPDALKAYQEADSK